MNARPTRRTSRATAVVDRNEPDGTEAVLPLTEPADESAAPAVLPVRRTPSRARRATATDAVPPSPTDVPLLDVPTVVALAAPVDAFPVRDDSLPSPRVPKARKSPAKTTAAAQTADLLQVPAVENVPVPIAAPEPPVVHVAPIARVVAPLPAFSADSSERQTTAPAVLTEAPRRRAWLSPRPLVRPEPTPPQRVNPPAATQQAAPPAAMHPIPMRVVPPAVAPVEQRRPDNGRTQPRDTLRGDRQERGNRTPQGQRDQRYRDGERRVIQRPIEASTSPVVVAQPAPPRKQTVPTVEVTALIDIDRPNSATLCDNSASLRSLGLFLPLPEIRRLGLRSGDLLQADIRAPGWAPSDEWGRRGQRYQATVARVITINGKPAEDEAQRPLFDRLTPIYPRRQIILETSNGPLAPRVIDMFAPIGFGQRALFVSPPKAGKTILLKQVAEGVMANHPNAHVIVCLIGERPEEVTDLCTSLPQASVYAASFDEEVARHGHIAELGLERAKRLTEQGIDVVLLVDSITRLARAYNLLPQTGGRTLSGGMDSEALTVGRRLFGAARNCEQGGSLTIIATCLVDTGSRLDDLVYEEFKGTGNMELHLNRELAERRIFPAIDLARSGTRHEELLQDEKTLARVRVLRRRLAEQPVIQSTPQLLTTLGRFPSNADMLSRIPD